MALTATEKAQVASLEDPSNQEILVKNMKIWWDIKNADGDHKAKFVDALLSLKPADYKVWEETPHGWKELDREGRTICFYPHDSKSSGS